MRFMWCLCNGALYQSTRLTAFDIYYHGNFFMEPLQDLNQQENKNCTSQLILLEIRAWLFLFVSRLIIYYCSPTPHFSDVVSVFRARIISRRIYKYLVIMCAAVVQCISLLLYRRHCVCVYANVSRWLRL